MAKPITVRSPNNVTPAPRITFGPEGMAHIEVPAGIAGSGLIYDANWFVLAPDDRRGGRLFVFGSSLPGSKPRLGSAIGLRYSHEAIAKSAERSNQFHERLRQLVPSESAPSRDSHLLLDTLDGSRYQEFNVSFEFMAELGGMVTLDTYSVAPMAANLAQRGVPNDRPLLEPLVTVRCSAETALAFCEAVTESSRGQPRKLELQR
jgi:hypothetical protein